MTSEMTSESSAGSAHRRSVSRAALATGKFSPKVREASLADYEQIAALQIRNGFSARSYEDWITLWEGNPVYQQWEGQWPIGWVLETENRDVVGWVGNIPSAYQFRKRQLYAATPGSWVVDGSHRGYGMLILNRLLRQKDVDLFVCSNVSSVSEPFTIRLRFSKVPVGAWNKSGFWISNYRGFVRIALQSKAVPLAAAMVHPLSAALVSWDRCRDGWVRPRSLLSNIERCWEFDSRFDIFWTELQRQNENVLLPVRTRETLTWHFRKALQQQTVWILAAHQGSRLVAYAIFDRQDNPAIGLRRVRLVDFQALNGSQDALLSALSWMLHECRAEGIHLLEILGCWLNRPGLPRVTAPFYRTMPSWSFYYKATDPNLTAQLRDPRVWAPSSFDGDTSL
jgi:hypothetical protein